jgi:hypothetical protein
MVNIVFYNLNHIGDCYISSFFINLIVEQNPNINFNYFFIQGDSFIKKKSNISRINKEEFNNSYSRILQSSEPPEELMNKNFLNFLLINKFQLSQLTSGTYNNTNCLFLNTWCASPIIGHHDFDLYSALEGWKRLIIETNKIIKQPLNFHITPPIDLTNMMRDYPDYELSEEEKNKMKDYVFIFNFISRSCHMNIGNRNRLIESLINNNNNKVMLANYEKEFENKNVLFFERIFNIKPTPDCLNLKYMWDIICHCKKIIILPCGATWTFFHKLPDLKKNQIYMFEGDSYITKLNNNIRFIDKNSEVQIEKI